jgi:putative ABC transport system permease protein
MIIAAILLEFIVPYFNMLVNRSLDVNYLDNKLFTGVFIGVTLITGMLSGFYPAQVLSGFSPSKVLKSSFIPGYKNPLFRKALVVFQFFISVALITTAVFFIKQLNFLKNKDLGFDKEEIIVIKLSQSDQQKLHQFRTELTPLTSINYIGCSDYLPMNSTNWTVFTWEGASDEDNLKMNINYIDPHFLDVYDIRLISGKGFAPEMAGQDQMYVLLNEKAVKDIGWEGDAVGKKIRWMVDYRTRYLKEAIVAGITSDFHYLPKHQPINPLIMPLLNKEATGGTISVKLNTSDIRSSLYEIETVFKDIYPEEIWNFEFANQVIDQLYREEINLSQLVKLFTGIAILITTMGLFGLISFSTNQRIKEIGIRKVMGASIYSIVGLLSKELVVLLVIANILAWPSAFLLIRSWLKNFVYHIDININVFIGATILSFLIALLTASIKIIRAASTNPVKSLRYE